MHVECCFLVHNSQGRVFIALSCLSLLRSGKQSAALKSADQPFGLHTCKPPFLAPYLTCDCPQLDKHFVCANPSLSSSPFLQVAYLALTTASRRPISQKYSLLCPVNTRSKMQIPFALITAPHFLSTGFRMWFFFVNSSSLTFFYP